MVKILGDVYMEESGQPKSFSKHKELFKELFIELSGFIGVVGSIGTMIMIFAAVESAKQKTELPTSFFIILGFGLILSFTAMIIWGYYRIKP